MWLRNRRITNVAVLGGGHSAAAIAFIARTSGLNATHINAYYALIDGGVADGWFTKLDALYVFATANSTTALLNLVTNAFNLTTNGTMTFTADSGYVSAGTPSYLDSGFNPTSASFPNFTQNSAHLSVWDALIIDGGRQVGTAGATNGDHIYANYSGGTALFRINDMGASGVSNGAASGHYLGNRSGASAWQGYINGTSISSGTDAAGTPDNSTFTFPDSILTSTDLLRAGSFGASLTPTDASNFYTRLNTFITTIHGSSP